MFSLEKCDRLYGFLCPFISHDLYAWLDAGYEVGVLYLQVGSWVFLLLILLIELSMLWQRGGVGSGGCHWPSVEFADDEQLVFVQHWRLPLLVDIILTLNIGDRELSQKIIRIEEMQFALEDASCDMNILVHFHSTTPSVSFCFHTPVWVG